MTWVLAGAVLLVVGILLLFLSPLSLEVSGDGRPFPDRARVRARWLHRAVIDFSLVYPDGRATLTLASRFVFPRQASDDAGASEEAGKGERATTNGAVEPSEPARPPADFGGSVRRVEWMPEPADLRSPPREKVSPTADGASPGVRTEIPAAERPTDPPGAREGKLSPLGLVHKLRDHKVTYLLSQRAWIVGLVMWLARVLRAFLGLVAFERLTLRLRLSAGDYAATGMIQGCFSAVARSMQHTGRERVSIDLETLFAEEPDLVWIGDIRFHTSLWRLVFPAIVAVATFPYVRTGIVWWRLRRRAKLQPKAVAPGSA